MLYILQTALELGLVYGLIPLALFLSYRILDVADLTTDGTFVLGMAVSVSLTSLGHPVLGIFAAMLSCAIAGGVTAMLQTIMGVPSILAGIITNTGLYTINLMAMGWSANISLLKKDTIFTYVRELNIGGDWYRTIFLAVIIAIVVIFLIAFLHTRLGLSIRATGDNPEMIQSSSINPIFTITVGLCLSNALTGLSGALVGQMQKSADINAGTGIVVIGLACLIIGETILSRKSISINCIAAVVGSIAYRFIYAIVLKTRIVPIECLKLLTAVIVALAIAMPTIKSNIALQKQKAVHKNKKEVKE